MQLHHRGHDAADMRVHGHEHGAANASAPGQRAPGSHTSSSASLMLALQPDDTVHAYANAPRDAPKQREARASAGIRRRRREHAPESGASHHPALSAAATPAAPAPLTNMLYASWVHSSCGGRCGISTTRLRANAGSALATFVNTRTLRPRVPFTNGHANAPRIHFGACPKKGCAYR
jgi:hypothetical protein